MSDTENTELELQTGEIIPEPLTATASLQAPAERIKEVQFERFAAGELALEDLQELHPPDFTSGNNARIMLRLRNQAGDLPEPFRTPALGLIDAQIGTTRGARQLSIGASGAMATGLDLIGADEISESMFELTMQASEQLDQELPRQTLTVEELIDRGTPSDFVSFTANALGEQVPLIASIILSGGASAGAGALVGRMAASGAVNPVQAAALVSKFATRGALIGGFASIAGLETGFTALEQVAATGEVSPFVATGAGLVKGALESAVPLAFASRFGLTRALSGKFMSTVDRTARELGAFGFAASAGITELTTEGLQEVVDIAARRFVDENYDALGPEAASRLLEAAVTGGLVGAVFGGIGGFAGRGGKAEPFQPLDPIDAQKIVARQGDQLELFPGAQLGREQPGAEQVLAQGELFPEAELGQAPEVADVSPEQLNLFDTPTEVGPEVQEELFGEGPIPREELAQGVFVVNPNTGNATLQSGEQLFNTIAKVGARDVQLFRVDPARADGIPQEAVIPADPLGGSIDVSKIPESLRTQVDPTTITAPSGINPNVAVISDRPFRGQVATPGEFAGELTEGITFQPRSQVVVGAAAGISQDAFNVQEVGRDRLFALDQAKLADRDITAAWRDAKLVEPDSPQFNFLKGTSQEDREAAIRLFGNARSRDDNRLYSEAVELGLRIAPGLRGFTVIDAENLSPSDFIEVSSLPTQQSKSIGEFVFENEGIFDSRLRDVSVRDAKGNGFPWTFSEHSPGEALIVVQGVPVATQRVLTRLQRQANILMKQLGFKDEKLVIFADTFPGRHDYNVSPNTEGTYWAIGGNRHLIGIARKTFKDPDRLAETFAHEMAHMVVQTEFRNLGAAGQEIIHNAYRRSMQGTVGKTFREGAFRVRAGDAARQAHQTFHGEDSTFDNEMSRRGLATWFNFDEWMAEQITRWQQTSERAVSFSDNWFKTIWSKLNKFFKSFDLTKPSLQPEIEMERWMESLLDRTTQAAGDASIQPLSLVGIAEATRESRQENADILDEGAGPLAPDVREAFMELADQQRGEPEAAMFAVQNALGGGVLNPVVERAGDIIHRMTNAARFDNMLRGNVQEMIEIALRRLNFSFPFEEEHAQNVRNNARARGQTEAEYNRRLDKALDRYAKAQRQLPVYNRLQWLAREIAISVGMKKWNAARNLLSELEAVVANEKLYEKEARKFIRDAEGSIRQYKPGDDARMSLSPDLSVAPDQSSSMMVDNVLGKLNLPSEQAALRPQISAELDKYNRVIKYGWNVLQLAIKNRHIRGLQTYVENLNRWYNKKMEIVTRGDGRVKEMQKLGKGQMNALSKVILEMVQLSQQPTPAEIIDSATKHNLGREGLELYAKITDDFSFMLNEMQRVLEQDARRTFGDPAILNAELSNLRAEFNRFRQQPYFPFMRFGDFTVVVRDPGKGGKVLHMEQFQFEAQQKAGLKRLRRQFPQALVRADKMPEEVAIFRGMPPAMLKNMGAKLSLSAKQLEWLEALTFAAAPSQSFRKQFVRRRNVPGFSEDVMRSYANYFFHGANHLSRAEFRAELENSIDEVENEARTLAGTTQQSLVKRRGIVDFMKRHLRYVMEPVNDWAFLRSAAFLYHIGFAPDSALVNLTQTPMVTYPYLAGRFSDGAALDALRKASFDLHKTYGSGKQNLDPLFLRALELGIQEGVLEETQATALAGVAEGSNLTRGLPGTSTARLGREVAYWGSWMFQQAEMVNRRIAFRAAYGLAKGNPNSEYVQGLRQSNPLQFSDLIDQGWAQEEALAYLAAKDAVRRTQFEYAAWARPRFMQGKKGTFFVFFNFLQNTLWFARHSPGRGRYLVILLGLAGLMGMPGAEDISDIAEFIGRKLFGKRFNLEEEMREFAVTHGFENPDLILHGISRDSFGMTSVADLMGLPMPSIDMSGRLGLGRIVPGVEGLNAGEFSQAITTSATDIAGAAFNIPINVMKSLSDNHPDLFKRWERSLPRALRNLSKARRFMIEGQEETRSGATLVEFDIHDPAELAEVVAQGLGFQPTRVSQRWNAIIAQRETLDYWATRRGILMQQFDWARSHSDSEAMADVRSAIATFNNEVPERALGIRASDLLRSARARARSRALEEQGLPGQRRQIPTARRTQELFPEVFREQEGEEEVR